MKTDAKEFWGAFTDRVREELSLQEKTLEHLIEYWIKETGNSRKTWFNRWKEHALSQKDLVIVSNFLEKDLRWFLIDEAERKHLEKKIKLQ